MMHNVNINQV